MRVRSHEVVNSLTVLLLKLLDMVATVSITVTPDRKVWEGNNVSLNCLVEGDRRIIWVREEFIEEGEKGDREIVAHDEQILVEDAKMEVRLRSSDKSTVSTLLVRGQMHIMM